MVEPGDSGTTVGCVLRLAPEEPLNRDDIEVIRVEQLGSSLTLDVNEELLSNIISINIVVDKVCFNIFDRQILCALSWKMTTFVNSLCMFIVQCASIGVDLSNTVAVDMDRGVYPLTTKELFPLPNFLLFPPFSIPPFPSLPSSPSPSLSVSFPSFPSCRKVAP